MFPTLPVTRIEKDADFFGGKDGGCRLGRFKECNIFESETMENIQMCLVDVEPDAMLP